MVNRQKSTQSLSPQQVDSLYAAFAYSLAIGKPLNRFLTFHLGALGLEQSTVHEFIIRFLHLVGDWLSYQSEASAHYVWVLENPVGGGLNLHIVLHIPDHLQKLFVRHQLGWIRKAGGKPIKKGLVGKQLKHYARHQRDPFARSKGVSADSYPLPTPFDDFLHHGLIGIFHYICKGLDPRYCAQWGIKPVAQGWILGKRCGVSESLSSKRRGPRIISFDNKPGIWIGSRESRGRRLLSFHLKPLDEPENERAK